MLSIQTITPDHRNGHYWRYVASSPLEFSENYFSDEWLQKNQAVTGSATGGRATARYLCIDGVDLVLRRFRRGGLAQKISKASYLWTGLEQTRAFAEFNCLSLLQQESLPAPAPYACEVIRHGFTYQASLITHRLSGQTLATGITENEPLSDSLMHQIGYCLARFHVAGVYHADLNAHNILVSGNESEPIAFIDFDKAQLGRSEFGEWRTRNLNRLNRSLVKELGKQGEQLPIDRWNALMKGYSEFKRRG